MLQLSSLDPIEFLLERKFPTYRSLQNQKRLNSAVLPTSPMDIPTAMDRASRENETKAAEKKLEEIMLYKADLKKKPEKEISALFEQEKAKAREEATRKAEFEESQRFFNQPQANADFEYWCKMDDWSIDEAIALSFGKSPDIVTWEKIKKFATQNNPSPFAVKYERLRNLTIRAKTFKRFFDHVTPGIYLSWAKENDIDIHQELLDQAEVRNITVTDWKSQYDKLKSQHDQLLNQLDGLSQHSIQLSEANNKLHDLLDNNKTIINSSYWQELEQKTIRALSEYPTWKHHQKKIQKTGNFQDWLLNTIGADHREAAILKKTLSDVFQELK